MHHPARSAGVRRRAFQAAAPLGVRRFGKLDQEQTGCSRRGGRHRERTRLWGSRLRGDDFVAEADGPGFGAVQKREEENDNPKPSPGNRVRIKVHGQTILQGREGGKAAGFCWSEAPQTSSGCSTARFPVRFSRGGYYSLSEQSDRPATLARLRRTPFGNGLRRVGSA